jgi:hypothetical protein
MEPFSIFVGTKNAVLEVGATVKSFGSVSVRRRQISDPDINGVVDILMRGFRKRTRAFWIRAFRRLSEHPTPPGFPKYGYLLEVNGVPVGVVLLIFTSIVVDGEERIRCNISSWYAEPLFRVYASLLCSGIMSDKRVTYFNITPNTHTWPILDIQGFERYCDGRFITLPTVVARAEVTRVSIVTSAASSEIDLPPHELELLLAHAKYGCISLVCCSRDSAIPFVFLPLRKWSLVPYVYLAYCRHLDDFVRFAGPLGRFLARRGFLLVVTDSNGPIKGLMGMYFRAPKYVKGPDTPRLGDIAFSERVIFGF